MVVVKHLGENLLVCFDYSMFLYNITSNKETKIEIPDYIPDPNSKEDPNLKEAKNISELTVSQSQEFFAIAKYKQVVIYRNNLEVVKNYTLKRAANSITFTPDNNVLVADKTGDVYMYSIADEAPKFILGHLSMLLDLTVSNDGKYLLTSDRDEKIRVSRFPNTYNIQRFCLGHTECVTGVEILDGTRALSCSGDGFMIVWDFLTGKILYRVNTDENVDCKDLVDIHKRKMNANKCEATCLPIINMKTVKIPNICDDTIIVFIVVEIYNSKTLQVYKLKMDGSEICVEFVQGISVDSLVKSFSLTERLFIFCENQVVRYMFNRERCNFEKLDCDENLNKFYISNKDVDNSEEFDISTLYKRKFHNVELYLEKKRQRIEKKK